MSSKEHVDECLRKALGEWNNILARPASMSFELVAEKFLAHVRANQKPDTFKSHRKLLEGFLAYLVAQALGHISVAQLKPHHLQEYVNKHPNWANNTKRAVIAAAKAALNWGVDQELIADNPLRRVKRPGAESRGEESRLSPDAVAKLLAACRRESQRNVLRGLYWSGCRPHELAGLDVSSLRGDTWFVTGKTGRRVVVIGPEFQELSERLAAGRDPAEPLFVNLHGGRWTPDSLGHLVRRVRKRAGVKAVPYAFRHTRATELLADGVPDVIVADQLGNSPAVLNYHYSHLHVDDMRKYLRGKGDA
jgi:integrase